MSKKYQLADLNNGAFGDVFDTIEAAEAALAEAVAEGQAINERDTPEGYEVPDASDFFSIVEVV
jgi:hypothetical protein